MEWIKLLTEQAHGRIQTEYGKLMKTWDEWNSVITNIEAPNKDEQTMKTITDIEEWGIKEAATEHRNLQKFKMFLNKALAPYGTTVNTVIYNNNGNRNSHHNNRNTT